MRSGSGNIGGLLRAKRLLRWSLLRPLLLLAPTTTSELEGISYLEYQCMSMWSPECISCLGSTVSMRTLPIPLSIRGRLPSLHHMRRALGGA